jgi:hypothetical protein
MAAFRRLEGERFGTNIVKRISRKTAHHIYWESECTKCGMVSHRNSYDTMRPPACRCKGVIGEKFGQLTPIKFSGKDKHQQNLWECRCDCGLTNVASTASLKSGDVKSCGCSHIKHGASYLPEYSAYLRVKDNFKSVDEFIAKIGMRPSPKHYLSRRNGLQPHSPTNTFWRNADDYRDLSTADLGDDYFVDIDSYCRSEASA